MVVLKADSHEGATCRLDGPDGVRIEQFSDPAQMLLAVGAEPPTLVVLVSHCRGLKLTKMTKALTGFAETPVYVGVWSDDASKKAAYRALEGGAKGLLAMPVTEQARRPRHCHACDAISRLRLQARAA